MKLENTTDFPNYFLRRMISWICGELEMPVRYLWRASFKNKTCHATRATSGYAYRKSIKVGIGTLQVFNCDGDYPEEGRRSRLGNLVRVTAHELAHVDNGRRGDKTRRGGRWGGSERYTQLRARDAKETFLKQWQELEAQWIAEPKLRACASPKKPIVEKRADRAAELLKQWEKKLKTAKTKVAKYKAKIKYYDRRKKESKG